MKKYVKLCSASHLASPAAVSLPLSATSLCAVALAAPSRKGPARALGDPFCVLCSTTARPANPVLLPAPHTLGAMLRTPLTLGHGPSQRWRRIRPGHSSSVSGAQRRASPRLVTANARPRRAANRVPFDEDRLPSATGWAEQQQGDWGASYQPQKPQKLPLQSTKHTLLDVIDAGALLGAAGGAAAALVTEQLAFAALPLVLPLLSLLASRQRETLRQQVWEAPSCVILPLSNCLEKNCPLISSSRQAYAMQLTELRKEMMEISLAVSGGSVLCRISVNSVLRRRCADRNFSSQWHLLSVGPRLSWIARRSMGRVAAWRADFSPHVHLFPVRALQIRAAITAEGRQSTAQLGSVRSEVLVRYPSRLPYPGLRLSTPLRRYRLAHGSGIDRHLIIGTSAPPLRADVAPTSAAAARA